MSGPPAGIQDLAVDLLDGAVREAEGAIQLGRSREGRPVLGYRFGDGPLRVSLIAGCHADEPVGPRLLRRLAGYLAQASTDDPILRDFQWWIVPHLNPDGRARNRAWQTEDVDGYDLVAYLRHAVREPPGDDIEFGFPRARADDGARPENRAVYDWWTSAGGAFDLHCTLHGMAFAAGPWFLIEPEWVHRIARMRSDLEGKVRSMGYRLHDVEREGEKGFRRIAPGFSTRPDSRAMERYFLERGDTETAGRFRPSSMEAIRSLGGDPLTLVSEMPLFVTPGVGEELGPPDPVARRWSERIERWRAELEGDGAERAIRDEARAAGLEPMPVRDQMELQWALIASGVSLVREAEAD